MWNNKLKAITFSYDDATVQDKRLVKLLNKYNIKATFNVNSLLLGKEAEIVREGVKINHTKINASEVKDLYEGHEIAVHTLTHPYLQKLEEKDVIYQVEQDRKNLEALAGYEISGMAYPNDANNIDAVAKILKEKTKIKYARTTFATHNFDLQDNLYIFNPTVHHVDFDALFPLGEKFIQLKPNLPQLFYIWGHSFEFDIHNTWDKFEEFLQMISNKDDIFYGTNSEVLGG